MFNLLAGISNFTLNLFIKNIIREPIIDESLFYIISIILEEEFCTGY